MRSMSMFDKGRTVAICIDKVCTSKSHFHIRNEV